MEYHAGMLEIEREIDRFHEVISGRLAVSLRQPVYGFDNTTIRDSVLAEFSRSDVHAILVWTLEKQELLCGMAREKGKLVEIDKLPGGSYMVPRRTDIIIESSTGISASEKIGEFEVCLDKGVARSRLFSLAVRNLIKTILIITLFLALFALISNRFIVKPLDQIRLAMLKIQDNSPHSLDSGILNTFPERLFSEKLSPAFSEVREIGTVLEDMVGSIKSRQEALQNSEERFSRAFNSSPNLLVLIDLETRCRMEVNEATLDITGYSKEELLEKSMGEFVIDVDKEKVRIAIEVLAETGSMHDIEVQIETKSGDRKTILYSGEYIDMGERQCAIITGQDITYSKHAERERRKLLQDLAEKNEELQSIVYVSSHDLRSPLVNIQGFDAELDEACQQLKTLLENDGIGDELLKQIEPLLNEDIPEALSFIRASSKKMGMLLDGLLSVSRAGSAEVKIGPVDMNELFRNIIQSTEFQIQNKDVEVVLEDLPGCMGDVKQLDQIFSNLISNALKYLDPERKGQIKIYGRTDGKKSIYCVEDNGIGIDPYHKKKVFELFHRLNPGHSEDGEGIGLTIASRAVSRNSGVIWVKSEPDKGSKFFVSLPAIFAVHAV